MCGDARPVPLPRSVEPQQGQDPDEVRADGRGHRRDGDGERKDDHYAQGSRRSECSSGPSAELKGKSGRWARVPNWLPVVRGLRSAGGLRLSLLHRPDR